MSLNYNLPVVSRSSLSLPIFSFALAVLVALPVLAVGANLFAGGTGETWGHLMATVLPEYVANSVWLCLGVGIGVAAMGTGAAWLVALNDFPGRRIAEWALLLPMAMPAYVLAYTYTDFLQFVGPLQTGLRESFGWQKGDYWFPEVRSLGGAIVLFSCVLYPYVYLLVRTAFLERAGGMIEAARPYEAQFIANGLPADFLARFTAARDELEKALGGRAAHLDLDPARVVANPAGEAQFPGQPPDEGAKADSLNDSADADVLTHDGVRHVSLAQQQGAWLRVRRSGAATKPWSLVFSPVGRRNRPSATPATRQDPRR